MKFLNPAGLWLLLGVPILIIIYLIRAQHEDRSVSSTYIWRLSDRFLKRNLPLQRIQKLLVFLMQLAMVIIMALLAARPAVINGESCDYILILDSSASMQTVDEKGVSRFEKAVEKIKDFTSEIGQGHTLSLILAGDEATFMLQECTETAEAELVLNRALCSNGGCDAEKAIALAQLICNESVNAQVIFFTDTQYPETNHVSVENLNENEWNLSLSDLTAKKEGIQTTFAGTLASFHQPCEVTVGLRIDGKVVDAKMVSCDADAQTEFSFVVEEPIQYSAAEVFLDEKDALSLDNSYVFCPKIDRDYSILLVSATPLYLKTALKALDNCTVSVVSSLGRTKLEGFDLYIFDGVSPEEYPQDGSIVQFGTSHLPEGIRAGNPSEKVCYLTQKKGIESELFRDVSIFDVAVTNYSPLTGTPAWEKLVFCEEETVLATRRMSNGMYFTVLAFDLHDTNFPIKSDYPLFVRNLVEYSVPGLVKKNDVVFGESVQLTVKPGVDQLYTILPDGSEHALSFTGEHSSVPASQLGVHTVIAKSREEAQEAKFFVHIPNDENVTELDKELEVRFQDRTSLTEYDAVSEIWFNLSLALLLILLAEWGWYCRERY